MSQLLEMPASLTEEILRKQERRLAPLGDQLLSAGILTSQELTQALELQSRKKLRLGETLLEMGLVKPHELLPFLAEKLNLPYAMLRDGLIDPKVVRMIPQEFAVKHKAIALFCVRNVLTVAMADPQNLTVIDELESMTECSVRPVLATHQAINYFVNRCYEQNFAVDSITADMDSAAISVNDDPLSLGLDHVESLAEGSPIINLVNYMILQAVRQGASDIHIEPGHRHTIVRFRIDGQLREVLKPRKEFHASIVSRLKVMAKMDIAEYRMPQDGRVHVIVDKREIDLRTSTLPTVLGEKIVIRVLDRAHVTFHLDHLGFSDGNLEVFKRMLKRPYGLLPVTGPTGSGKTTTLYSAIELIKSIHQNIVTVEDPVEYQFDGINQVNVNATGSLSFAKALRAILRQDPDVIMIGEMRDLETAEVGIQAALTGHLVLSTLHSGDAISALLRFVDMGVPIYKLSSALIGILSQRLIRRICPHCKISYFPTVNQLELIGYEGDRHRQFLKGEGCQKCFDSGYRGRMAIYEILEFNRDLRDLLTRELNIDLIRDWHRSTGAKTLLQDGVRAAINGDTSLEEVIRVVLFE